MGLRSSLLQGFSTGRTIEFAHQEGGGEEDILTKRKILQTIALTTLTFTASWTIGIFGGATLAQPTCDWDCMTMDCCSPGYQLPCNGGAFASMCPDACVGAGAFEAPSGTCPAY